MYIDEEVILVEDEIEVKEPIELQLSGVLLTEEILAIINLCKKEKILTEASYPLYISFQGERKYVGHLEMSFTNLLSIYNISDKYELKIIDNVGNRESTILGEGNPLNGESLMKVINLC